jgi:KDO2-lipid IV(A) lauroyltransferase
LSFKKLQTDFLIGIAKLMAKLPITFILNIGAGLGYLTWLIPNKRKKIAAKNITLCFPDKSTKEHRLLVKQNLISTGVGFAETIIAHWSKTDKFIHQFEFEGLNNFEQAINENKGCILLSCHLHAIELAVRVINNQLKSKAYMLSRQHNNKIFQAHIDQARRAHCEKTIDKKDVRTVLKSLKNNHPVYYFSDQNFSYNCEYIDFFKQPAATVVAPVKIAQSSQASVVPWFCFRENKKWKIQFLEPLKYFHTDEIKVSLRKMNQLFEEQINLHPEQYLWVHRRFKNHPDGKNFYYKDL